MKKIRSFILKISITLCLLIFLFGKTDLRALFGVARNADISKMLLAFLLFVFLNFLVVLRWRLLLKGLCIPVSFARLASSYMASLFFNLVLPSTIGGDAVRTLDIAGHTKTHSSGILATVILDRASGFFGLFTVLACALVFGYGILGDENIFLVSGILLLIMVFSAGIMFSGRFFKAVFGFLPFAKLKDYLLKIHQATRSFKHKAGILAGAWFLSVIIQAGLSVTYFFIARAIGLDMKFIYFLLFVPVITVFSVIPISLGGLGVRDAACVAIFTKAGATAEKALWLSLSNFGFMLVLGILGGAIYVFNLYRRRV
ncbi:MAG: hypothetical protein AUJ74_01680 [Candidatus Omnitrophica bacterium CG1_02_44_16]|nr:MAG: hypothetical protein AUJ74_01680 [Candidatus Omnitrophica bacterium CG1_02_44_16]PIY82773.1 MAG: hypothetical protein COY78_04920 [Candidatus Omnitrophica bacterium CG_4_10_14_0_8_um_filter_44_12]PIZ83229.1 MAG: hypothetical protein COX96_08640 [Candidatus Omnitrophica bacterium CG_4_10_14_0_2_um_filter_44_9]